MGRPRTNWHSATADAIRITLRDYENILEYRRDISLTFVSRRFPRKLIGYLTEECKKEVADPFPGVYNISGDIFPVQILVTGRLSPETSLYLKCLTNNLQSAELIDRLAEDYTGHQNEPHYEDYMDQLINANMPGKGEDSPMCCEGIFRLYGTSSKEIAANAVAPLMEVLNKTNEALNKTTEDLNKTTEDLNKTTEDLNTAKKQNDYLRQLLEQHGIAYESTI